ncbi:MAG: bifunctional phosphoribosylaminoimidazolecarboxamide formyltransferase/IMP cyclohydrolase [Deltaproteobacteria bacterium]|nr:bifunctional phosphoribosylaminoimidazolecarboxamide formyltransferase/IMP cyclohydrolase [Deltaproteobacteria bacterium]
MTTTKVRRALLSVHDKRGLLDLGRALAAQGAELLASGGTATHLRDGGLAVTAIEAFTGSPEVLDGRVKTLHPKVAAGILADRRNGAHLQQLKDQGWVEIDLVVCNLYPFAATVARRASPEEIIENIDIGGPTLVRAAAKNAAGGVAVVVDPDDYGAVEAALANGDGLDAALRRQLAAKAFGVIAAYDASIAEWFVDRDQDGAFAPRLGGFVRETALRYGENPHQQACLYRLEGEARGVAHGEQLAGKELSYNNYLDMDAALRAVIRLPGQACAIVKHTNPCGLAEAESQAEAFRRALSGDPLAAFGSILGFNRGLEIDAVQAIKDSKLFVECIVAPDFAPEVLAALAKRENLRLFRVPGADAAPGYHAHRIGGGLLVQSVDKGPKAPAAWRVVTRRGLEPGWLEDLWFAMHCAAVLKSNAIAITTGKMLVGAGAGQMSRVDAVEQAVKKAGARAQGAFLGSDAFFPFPDGIEAAAKAGVVAVAQPGGSKKDAEVIAACDRYGLAMVFCGERHFRH